MNRANLLTQAIIERAKTLFAEIDMLETEQRIEIINTLRLELHRHSPFITEPIDCVLWIKTEHIEANEYNPNHVAPPEMRLLEHSIKEDGYTQPVVTWAIQGPQTIPTGPYEVIDGFHRMRIGKESKPLKKRLRGYLPVTVINGDRTERKDRIAATIRHNRARGKHQVQAMSEIIVELARRNWSDARIGKELGMQADEVLRLKQISGLAEIFADREFSEAWEVVEGENIYG